ncbi:hypothetical protein HORIV_56140 [Vreelandella olivaria]|uniref:4Fe-4S ferredoxin-type domain-containing protein n=1 Tax=Vreelandella olivaria TaxID=390919 RepID=A0ABN5X2V2_9GAMM|nr:hypothetical protein HORIV_56140 [Halomonas olivaria]
MPMALMITDECINCDVCEPECPNDAISPVRRSTSSTLIYALNVSATTMSPSASRSARWTVFRWIQSATKAMSS